MSSNDNADTIHRVLLEIRRRFPNLHEILAKSVPKGTNQLRGVIRIGHLPEYAPQAYLHWLFPPPDQPERLWFDYFRTPMPAPLVSLYSIVNGATLFHDLLEIWGFQVHDDKFLNPAYEVRGKRPCDDSPWYSFASSNYGGTVAINAETHQVRMDSDEGGETLSFCDLDTWLLYEGNLGDDVFT